MVATKLLKINLKNLIADFLALGWGQAVDGRGDGQCGEGPFLEQNVTRSVTPELLAAF